MKLFGIKVPSDRNLGGSVCENPELYGAQESAAA